MSARRTGGALLALVLAAMILTRPAAPLHTPTSLEGRADRVVIVTIPGLRWPDVDPTVTPTLHAFASEAGVALLAPQTAARVVGADDAYATLGAGARVVGSARAIAYEPDELVRGQTAEDRYRASTGRRADSAALLVPGVGSLRSVNEGLPYSGEPGALAEQLASEGLQRLVIAAADVVDSAGEVHPRRNAALALLDVRGTVDLGATGASVLVADPGAPFGLRYDVPSVLAALDRDWAQADVMLVEASMTARAAAEAPQLDAARQVAERRAALAAADELVAGVLRRADDRTAVLVVAPYARDTELGVVALHAPEVAPGLLRSASTRRAGHLLLVDVAPTVLGLLGADRPPSMEGRSAEVLPDERPAGTRLASLRDLEDAAHFRDGVIGGVAAAWIVLQVVALGLSLVAWRARPGLRSPVLTLSLALLLFLPVTFLAALLPLHEAGIVVYALVGVLGATVLAVLVRSLTPSPLLAVQVALAILLGVLGLDAVAGSQLQMNSVFGYTATVAGRFSGIGNLAFAQLSAAALLLAALVARPDGRRSLVLPAGILTATVLVDGLPTLGADVGGVLTVVPAAGLLLIMLRGRRLRPMTFVLLGLAAIVVLGSFLAADLAQPEEARTHLARLAESVGDTGFDAFTVIARRKVSANLGVLLGHPLTLAVPVVLALAGWVFWRGPGPYGELQRRLPTLRAGLAAFFLAGVLGFALNDSGIAVPAVAYGVLNATLCALVVGLTAEPTSSPPDQPPPQDGDARRYSTGSEPVLVGA